MGLIRTSQGVSSRQREAARFKQRLAALAAGGILLWSAALASAGVATRCISHRVAVPQLSDQTYVHGTLCTPDHALSNDVLVLVPGATYDGAYWNVSLDPATYNFRLAMNRAGYATFDLDRLGTGQSSVPLSVLVRHQLQPDGFGGLATSLAPADLDPAFSHWDPGYLTTLPGHRDFLYGQGDLTPAMRAYDESIKRPVSGPEIATALGTIAPIPNLPLITQTLKIPPTGAIAVPVLSINGAQDKLFCNPTVCASSTAYQHSEAPHYQDSPDFQAWILPNAGHDINLARDTRLYQRRVIDWLRAVAR